MKYAFFLGAGASKSCGAPLQGEMLKEYFVTRQGRNNPYDHEYFQNTDIYTFFDQFFGIDIEHDNLNNISFPTFEEILGIIDLAIMRKETFPNFENGNVNLGATDRLFSSRDRFVGLMAIILRDKLNAVNNNHEDLIRKLSDNDMLKEILFISTNYDILIDNALLRSDCRIDYGFEFRNRRQNNGQFKVPLYKLHGSLNWLYCPTCKKMELTPFEKGAVNYYNPYHFADITCSHCSSVQQPIIVPPTYFKEFTNYQLNQVWYKAEQSLKKVNTIFFCGYSFPDADVQIKYLLKRAETIGRRTPLDIVVTNYFRGKSAFEIENEHGRYCRFFRQGRVRYLDIGFEQLINELEQHLQ